MEDACRAIAACLEGAQAPSSLYPRLAHVAEKWLEFPVLSHREQDGVRTQMRDLRETGAFTKDQLSSILDVIESTGPEVRSELLEWLRTGAAFPLCQMRPAS